MIPTLWQKKKSLFQFAQTTYLSHDKDWSGYKTQQKEMIMIMILMTVNNVIFFFN